MKKNAFGEPILQNGDDIMATFSETFDTDPDQTITAFDLDEDGNFGWSAIVRDEDFNEMQVHDFDTEESLIMFLVDQGVVLD